MRTALQTTQALIRSTLEQELRQIKQQFFCKFGETSLVA
jgi:hypothetical protein